MDSITQSEIADKTKSNDSFGKSTDCSIVRLLEIMAKLRDPDDGCPWDLEQDFGSIARYTIEEAYEVADAVERENWTELKAELGDLLLQTVYHCQIATELEHFSFEDVVDSICQKMVSRHPHVFGNAARPTASQQNENWERTKAVERETDSNARSALDGVATALPALMRAQKLQNRAARVGFDWPNIDGVVAKVLEEANEFTTAFKVGNESGAFEEFGDLMFTMVNLGRHAGIDSEAALRFANEKFRKRFVAMEDRIRKDGKNVEECSAETLDDHWIYTKGAESVQGRFDG